MNRKQMDGKDSS